MSKKLSAVDKVLGSFARMQGLQNGHRRVTEIRRAYYAGLREGSGAEALARIQRGELPSCARHEAQKEIAQESLQKALKVLEDLRKNG